MNTNEPKPDALMHDNARSDVLGATDDNPQNAPNNRQTSHLDDNDTPLAPMHANARSSTQKHAFARLSMHERARARIDAHGRVNDETFELNEADAAELPISEETISEEPQSDNLDNDPAQSEWIELEETVQLLRQKGIERAVRSIQRYCQVDKLTCMLTPTEKGARYLVKRSSVFDFINQHNSTMPDRKSSPLEKNMNQDELSNHDQTTNHQKAPNPSNSISAEHNKQILELKDQQIDMLTAQLAVTNNQLEMKDDQIATMLERDKETHILLHNLQTMVSLPSAKEPDHRSRPPYDIHAEQGS